MAFDLCCDMAQETATNHQLQWLVVTARNAGRHSRVSLSNRLEGFSFPGRPHIKDPRHIFGHILTQFHHEIYYEFELPSCFEPSKYIEHQHLTVTFQLNHWKCTEFPMKSSTVQAAPVSQPASVDREV